MKIHLPNSAFLGNIDPFLRSFDSEKPGEFEITSNEKWISIHPLVISMVAVLGLSLKDISKVNFKNFQAKSRHYLERMGLFKVLGIESGISITEHDASGRFVPLRRITNSDELSIFLKDMTPLLHLTPSQAEPIRYVVSELVRNVFEHSDSKTGALVCAQYYQKSNRISIGVADRGVGIKKTISKSYPVQNDIGAIKLALTPGITGATRRIGGTEVNAGAGLFFIKSIAKVNRDFFVLYSGKGMYKLLKTQLKRITLNSNPFLDKSSSKEDFPYWQGTAVGIDISLDKNQSFDSLLGLIGDVYYKEIQERKRNQFRRPRFV